VLAFAALSVASIVAWRRVQKVHPATSDEPHLNRRGAQCVGQRGALALPIVNGRGRIQLGDGSWPVTGPDLPAGATVEVIGADGTLLRVQPVAEVRVGAQPQPVAGEAPRPEGSSA
jgi:inner membrane protein